MSGDTWGESWLFGGDWYDWRQNQRLEEELASVRASAAGQAIRLNAQLAKVQGTLDHRLSKLAAAFDAFVELSDVREQLRAFQPAVMARHRARLLLARAAGTADRLPAGEDEPGPRVPGYWLSPAAEALAATLRDDVEASRSAVTDAEALDADRTDAFLCATFALIGRHDEAIERLDDLLRLDPGRPVTRLQQALWEAAADGRFGDDGRDLLEARLAGLVAAADPHTELAAWQSVVDGLGPAAARKPKGRSSPGTLRGPLEDVPLAARRLEALRAWCAERFAAAAADPAAVSPVPVGPASATVPTGPGAAGTQAGGTPDPLIEVVRTLVDEGAPEERVLLARAAELRRAVETDGRTAPPPVRWDAVVGDPLKLLRSAAISGATPWRRAAAVRAGGPFLLKVADRLVAEASASPPPTTELRVGRHVVRFGRDGADPESLAAARARVEADTRTEAKSSVAGGAVVTIGLILVVAGLAAATGLAVLGLVVAAGGGAMLWSSRSSTSWATRHRASEVARLDQDVARSAAALQERHAKVAAAHRAVPTTAAALRQLLAPPAESPGPAEPAEDVDRVS